MLGITIERKTLSKDSGRSENASEVVRVERQDHDSEERGVLRQHSDNLSVDEGIEMEDLQPRSTLSVNFTEREQDEFLRNSNRLDIQHPLEIFYTGEIILANVHLWDTVRAQWQATNVSAEGTNPSASGVQAAVVAAAAGRTLNYRLN